jgi:hypothetical protein
MNDLGVCYDAFCNSGPKRVYLMDLTVTEPDFLLLARKVPVQNLCRRSARFNWDGRESLHNQYGQSNVHTVDYIPYLLSSTHQLANYSLSFCPVHPLDLPGHPSCFEFHAVTSHLICIWHLCGCQCSACPCVSGSYNSFPPLRTSARFPNDSCPGY